MIRKASVARVHKPATGRGTTTESYCCTTNLITLACLPLSSIKYDTEHLMMLGSSLRRLPCRLCYRSFGDTGSKELPQQCHFNVFFPEPQCLFNGYLSCCGVKKMGLLQNLRGGDEEVSERGRCCPLNPCLIMVNTPLF